MQKSYKGVKSGRGCEGIIASRRCAAEGASIFDQTSPRVVVDGSYSFLRFISGAKEFVELQNQSLIWIWWPHLNRVLNSSRRDTVMRDRENHALCLRWQGLLPSRCPD